MARVERLPLSRRFARAALRFADFALRLLGFQHIFSTCEPCEYPVGLVTHRGRVDMVLRAGTLDLFDHVEDPSLSEDAVVFPPSLTRRFVTKAHALYEVWGRPCRLPRPLADVTLAELAMTCMVCPAQWEGKTTGGREVYIRYRHGRFTVDLNGFRYYSAKLGDDSASDMTTEEMLAYTGMAMAPGVSPTGWADWMNGETEKRQEGEVGKDV